MYVGVTLHYEFDQMMDLDLPGGIQAGNLAARLGAYFTANCGTSASKSDRSTMVKFVLKHHEGDCVLAGDLTLQQASVCDGDHLTLLMKRLPAGFISWQEFMNIPGPALVDTEGRIFPVSGAVVLIGRPGPENNVPGNVRMIEPCSGGDEVGKDVSHQHALIERRREGFGIVDLGSRNGSYLNGKKLIPFRSAGMIHGDRISFGGWRLVFIWDYQEIVEGRGKNEGL